MSKLEPRSWIRGLLELGPLVFRALTAPTHAGSTLGCRVTPCCEGGPGKFVPKPLPGLRRLYARPFPASNQPALLRMLRPLHEPALRVFPQPGGQIRTRLRAGAPGKNGGAFRALGTPGTPMLRWPRGPREADDIVTHSYF